MTEHTLKTDPPAFDAVERGDKTFEVRRDDRGFQKGDVLILEKFDRVKQRHVLDTWGNRQTLRRKIKFILTGGQYGIEPGHVVMAIRK